MLVPNLRRTPKARHVLSLADFKPRLDAELVRVYDEAGRRAEAVDPLYVGLIDEVAGFVGRGGKRLRPYLCYLGYRAHGGTDDAAILRVAAAQELYHSAWLMHDDVIDRDLTRYGGDNVAGAYRARLRRGGTAEPDARHFGDAMAIIAGDISMTLAIESIARSGFEAKLTLDAILRQQRTSFELAGGEQLDVLIPTLPADELTTERLLKVCRFKTASYSFEGPLQVGAILAGAKPADVAAFSGYALPLGVAYQLHDDLLGMFGDEVATGKPVISDLREGKRTILILDALHNADATGRATIEAALGNATVEMGQLDAVRHAVESSGARSRTEALARREAGQAAAALSGLDIDPIVQASLSELIVRLSGRSA